MNSHRNILTHELHGRRSDKTLPRGSSSKTPNMGPGASQRALAHSVSIAVVRLPLTGMGKPAEEGITTQESIAFPIPVFVHA